jgi:hypothetical protein
MRLYASGTLFNGLYSIMRTQQSSLSSLDDMRPTHLLIVMGLAFMGLVTVSEGVTRWWDDSLAHALPVQVRHRTVWHSPTGRLLG